MPSGTSRPLDWTLLDNLAMHVGDIVLIEGLFADYRKWILDHSPFGSAVEELESIMVRAPVDHRLFALTLLGTSPSVQLETFSVSWH